MYIRTYLYDQNHQICGSYILLMKFEFFCKEVDGPCGVKKPATKFPGS